MSLEGKSVEDIEALAELANALGNNPATRMDFLRLTKKANPTANIPEIDIPIGLQGAMQPHLDRLAQLEAQAVERDTRDRITSQRKQALSVSGITEADMPAVEKLMTDRRILDHKTAAEFHVAQQRLAEPTPSSLTGMRTFGKPVMPDLAAFQGNLQAHARNEAYAAIDQLRGRRAT